MRASICVLLLAAAPLIADAAHAASLQASPVSLEVHAPAAATTLNLINTGATPINAQIRVFRWTQQNGEERLDPAESVVASPPAAALQPRTQYTIRIVRIDRTPFSGEDTYRVIVDEIPDPNRSGVNIAIRYSIPLFFVAPDAAAAQLSWTAAREGNRLALTATNQGDRHVRLSALKGRDRGASVSFGDGLAGYVLGRSIMRFPSKTPVKGFASGSVTVQGDSEAGRINAVVPIAR